MAQRTFHLAADIGGTKTNLALFAEERDRLVPIGEESLPTKTASGPMELLASFLRRWELLPTSAGIGFAGTVKGGEARAVNLPWTIREDDLRDALGIRHLYLLNDLEAMAHAVPHLRPEQKTPLHPGKGDPGEPIGVLAAGTGLGQAVLIKDGDTFRVLPSEGGHRDFAPLTAQQFRLAEHLRRRYGRVSIERVLSGQGLLDLHCFLLAEDKVAPPAWLAEAIAAHNAAPLTAHALAGTDPRCEQSVLAFATVYGTEAGNLALQYLAGGGIYLGGGIAPNILPFLRRSAFREAFLAKGRLRPYLEHVPVWCITDTRAPLIGAAHYAAARAKGC